MSEGQSDDDFNRDRAELFEALGHPTRIKILEVMKDGPASFSELKKAAGIQSSGHLAFHLDKLKGLVEVASDGRYTLTDDGKDAIRFVGHRASRPFYPNVAIVIWMAAMFVSFGLLSNLFDQYGVLYNLGQGAFVALFMGAFLWLVRWLALRRTKAAR